MYFQCFMFLVDVLYWAIPGESLPPHKHFWIADKMDSWNLPIWEALSRWGDFTAFFFQLEHHNGRVIAQNFPAQMYKNGKFVHLE